MYENFTALNLATYSGDSKKCLVSLTLEQLKSIDSFFASYEQSKDIKGVEKQFTQDSHESFHTCTEEDVKDLWEDLPFLRSRIIMPLPSPEDCLLFLDESGRFLMFIYEMSVVYQLGQNLYEGWKNFIFGSKRNWSLVVNRMDSETGTLLDDAIGMDTGITTLVIERPNDYNTFDDMLYHIKTCLQDMVFVKDKDAAFLNVCNLINKEKHWQQGNNKPLHIVVLNCGQVAIR